MEAVPVYDVASRRNSLLQELSRKKKRERDDGMAQHDDAASSFQAVGNLVRRCPVPPSRAPAWLCLGVGVLRAGRWTGPQAGGPGLDQVRRHSTSTALDRAALHCTASTAPAAREHPVCPTTPATVCAMYVGVLQLLNSDRLLGFVIDI